MNLLLLLPSDFTTHTTDTQTAATNTSETSHTETRVADISHSEVGGTAIIYGRRFEHIIKILKSKPGDTLSVGKLHGNTGKARIQALNKDHAILEIEHLTTPPPPTLPVQLILGLPRPRMLHRLLQTVTTMGVEKLHLLQTARVEKSFWQTPLLQPQAVEEQLILGLEQGKATQKPEVVLHQRFIPFMEDTLPTLLPNTQKYIAHPGDYPLNRHSTNQPTLLAIGPEGGFLTQEVQRFNNAGFTPLQLGERILKVETAVPVALAKLF